MSLSSTTLTEPQVAPDLPTAPPPSGSLWRKWQVLIARVGAVVALVLLWQFLPTSIVPHFAVSTPGQTARAFGHLFTTGTIWPNLWATVEGVLIGLGIGAPVGCILAGLFRVRAIAWLLEPVMTMANAVPKVALISLFILWLGLGATSHLALVVSFVVFVFFYNTQQAFKEVDPDRVIALQLLGVSRPQLFRLLVAPSAFPFVLAAARVAVPLAFGAQVFAELRIATPYGLGALLLRYSQSLYSAGAIAVMLLIGAIGYILDIVMGNRLSRYVSRLGLGERS
jgi:NitT/TauT family transport system permease protein